MALELVWEARKRVANAVHKWVEGAIRGELPAQKRIRELVPLRAPLLRRRRLKFE